MSEVSLFYKAITSPDYMIYSIFDILKLPFSEIAADTDSSKSPEFPIHVVQP